MASHTRLYKVLGVSPKANAKTLKKAYRKLARKHHPDRNPGDAGAEDRFKEIGSAWEVLGDPEKRKQYDTWGDAALQSGFDPQAASAHAAWQQQQQQSWGGDGGFSPRR